MTGLSAEFGARHLADCARFSALEGTSVGRIVRQLRAENSKLALSVPDDEIEAIARRAVGENRVRSARKTSPDAEPGGEYGVTLHDFRAYMPMHRYIFMPNGAMWPGASVNARVPPVQVTGADGTPELVKATAWLDQHRPVEQMTWIPGSPSLISDQLVVDGGWIERPGCTTVNLYRPPREIPGRAEDAGPWIEHVHRVYPADAPHIITWLAHRVQRPGEKVNHALVLGGLQGIGKDTLL